MSPVDSWICGAGLLVALLVPGHTAVGAVEPTVSEPAYALYFVVPEDERTFDEADRKELGIQGPLKTHWPTRNRFRRKHGYLAWLSKSEVERIKAHPEVREVLPYLPDDVVVAERPRGVAKNYLDVQVVPSSWKAGVDPATYLAPDVLADEWKKRFEGIPAVSVSYDEMSEIIRITFDGVKPDPAVVDAIRRSGQVQYMHWRQDPKPAADAK